MRHMLITALLVLATVEIRGVAYMEHYAIRGTSVAGRTFITQRFRIPICIHLYDGYLFQSGESGVSNA